MRKEMCRRQNTGPKVRENPKVICNTVNAINSILQVTVMLSAVELVNALIIAKPDYSLKECVARIHTGMLCL